MRKTWSGQRFKLKQIHVIQMSRYGFLSTQKLYFSRYICATILGSWLTPVGIYCVWYITRFFLMRIFILEVTVQQYRTSISDYLVNIDTIISSIQGKLIHSSNWLLILRHFAHQSASWTTPDCTQTPQL
jgi:hypothetical protein